MSIWSLVIEGDAVSVNLFANKEDLYTHLRKEWLVPDDVSDEDAPEWISDEAYSEVVVHIEEHPVPEASKPTPRDTWEDSVRKTGKCGDKLCACSTLNIEEDSK